MPEPFEGNAGESPRVDNHQVTMTHDIGAALFHRMSIDSAPEAFVIALTGQVSRQHRPSVGAGKHKPAEG